MTSEARHERKTGDVVSSTLAVRATRRSASSPAQAARPDVISDASFPSAIAR